jgi:hypothetical protein
MTEACGSGSLLLEVGDGASSRVRFTDKKKDGSSPQTFDYASPIPPFRQALEHRSRPVNDAYERFQPLGTPPAKQTTTLTGFPAWSPRTTG